MALIQRTFASGSIWVGTGSSFNDWDSYAASGLDHKPLAIYNGSSPLLDFTSSTNLNRLTIYSQSSLGSPSYISGFAGLGFKIFANPKTIDDDTRLYWTGLFDDLWVRGSMHVKEFVIDKIRATNGSLWVSDAGQAESASFVLSGTNTGINYSGTMSLYFAVDTTMPFIPGDIIRSKQWINDASTITANWDFLGGVSQTGTLTYDDLNLLVPTGKAGDDIAYNVVQITMSRTGVLNSFNYTNHYYAGNNPESTIQDFINTISVLNTDWVRAGNLNLNSDRQGYIYLTSNDLGGPFIDVANDVDTIVGALGGTALSALNGGFAETQSVSQSNIKMRMGNLAGIADPAFGGSLSGYGMWADNAYLRGWIVANEGGNIAGWNITPNTMSNASMTISAGTNPYIGIGTNAYDGDGVWFGRDSIHNKFSVGNGSTKYIRWTGTDLEISSSNFNLSEGNVSMSGVINATSGVFNGSIFSTIGDIGGWDIFDKGISKSVGDKSIALRIETSSVWNEIDNTGYSFNLESESPIFTVSYKYYDQKVENAYAWTAITNTSSISAGDDGQAEISFTASAANSYKAIVNWKGTAGDFTVQAGETVHVGLKKLELGSNNPLNTSPYYDKLTLLVRQKDGSLALAYTTLFEQVLDTSIVQVNDTFIAYTNTASVGITCSVLITQKSAGRGVLGGSGGNIDVYGITASNLFIGRSRGYTELNPHGLLVYASPTGYIKLTTDRTGSVDQNYAIASFDELYVAGLSIKGGFSGGSGGTTPVDPSIDGTLNNTFTINKDGDTSPASLQLNVNSNPAILDYNGITASFNKDLNLLGNDIASTGTASFGQITASHFTGSGTGLTGLNASNLTSGTINSARLPIVPVTKGGTGLATLPDKLILLGNGTSTLSSISNQEHGRVLISGGTEATPFFSKDVFLGGDLQIAGTASFNGNVTLGDVGSDVITSLGRFTASNGISASALNLGSLTNGYIPYSNNGVIANSYIRQSPNLINIGAPLAVTGAISATSTGSFFGLTSSNGILASGGNININSGYVSASSYAQFGGSLTASAFRNIGGQFKVNSSGDLLCYSLKLTSLRLYKHDIFGINTSQLDNILRLNPVTFLYNADQPENINDVKIRQAGFIAELMLLVYPLVCWYKDGELAGVQYQRLTAYLVKGMQLLIELNAKMSYTLKSNKKTITALNKRVTLLLLNVLKILLKLEVI